jgi:AcrR family transcriptional regulator
MIQIVAERGYEAVRLRELVLLAGVSSRAFYEHFESKEDCFLRTYELIVGRATRRIFVAQMNELDWHARARTVFVEFARELKRAPDAARFALIEAYITGPAALEQARSTECRFQEILAESLARDPRGAVVPPIVLEGITAGVVHVARARLLIGREGELLDLESALMKWALSYIDEPATALVELDNKSVWRNTVLEPHGGSSIGVSNETWLPKGNRTLILAAVAKHAAADGYHKLTVSRIHCSAGVSRKEFKAHFKGVEDCFIAALEHRVREALGQAARAQAASRTWPGGIYRSIAALCECIEADPFLARACLTKEFAVAGVDGRRCRRRLTSDVIEQLAGNIPREHYPGEIALEATEGAIWAVFHRHLVKDRRSGRKVAAALSYLALSPMVGASAAVAAIRNEQAA